MADATAIEKLFAMSPVEWSPEVASAIPRQQGIYAIFLKKGADLPADLAECVTRRVRDYGLIYIGIAGGKGSASTLRLRLKSKHFEGKNAGASTLRLSIGALLKKHLCLVAIPRSPNSKPGLCRFTKDGEASLSDWMQKSLRFVFLEVAGITEEDEKEVIRHYKPPLNINHNKQHVCALLESARDACRNEARANAG